MDFIEELYELKQKNQENKVIECYCKNLDIYSYFNGKMIGEFLAELICIYEGKNYVYQEVKLKISKNKSHFIKLIINKKFEKSEYDIETLENLIGKELLILDSNNTYKYGFSFYKAKQCELNQNVTYGNFTYIKLFVDSIIKYKIDNGKRTLEIYELDNLKAMLLKNNTDQILSNYFSINSDNFNKKKQLKTAKN